MTYKNRKRERPRQQEEEVARDIRGKRQKASGAMPHAKGDAVNEVDLVDAKTTSRSYSLNAAELQKVALQARGKGRVPVLQLEFTSMPRYLGVWAVIPWDEYLARSGYQENDGDE